MFGFAYYLQHVRNCAPRLAVYLLAGLGFFPLMSQAETPLPGIVSLNMCADPYLMEIAAPEQILGLAPQSHDPALSAFTEQTRRFPVSSGRLDEIARLQPNLLILSRYSSARQQAMAARLGIPTLTLDAGTGFSTARDDILKLGQAIGREQQAKDYLTKLDAELAEAQSGTADGSSSTGSTGEADKAKPRLLSFQRRGLVVGEGHLLDDIITRAGAENLGRRQQRLIGPMGLETVLRLSPDFLISSETGTSGDRGSEVLSHPALQKYFPAGKRITIPANLVLCAGASTPAAIRFLKQAMREAVGVTSSSASEAR